MAREISAQLWADFPVRPLAVTGHRMQTRGTASYSPPRVCFVEASVERRDLKKGFMEH